MNNIEYVIKKQLTLNLYYIQCRSAVDRFVTMNAGRKRKIQTVVTDNFNYVFPEINDLLIKQYIGNIHQAAVVLMKNYNAIIKTDVGTTLWFENKQDAENAIEFLESLKVISKLIN